MPARPADAGIVKVADEIVREEFQSAPNAPATPAAPGAPRPAASEPSVRPTPPPVELDWSTDLVQVESNPNKVKATQHDPAAEEAPRQRRERPARPSVAEEPLVQVETGGKSPAGAPPA